MRKKLFLQFLVVIFWVLGTLSVSEAANSITVTSSTGGTATVDKTTANAGDEIIVTITFQTNYELQSVSIRKTGDISTNVPFYCTAYKCYFTMPDHPVTVDVQFYQSTGPAAFPNFETTTLNGDTVTQEIFSGNKLTMVNFWATWCAPCTAELYDLAQLGTSMPDGTQLLGVLVPRSDGEIAEAKQMLTEVNSNFTQILYTNSMNEVFDYYPVTFFVDSAGNFVGEMLSGARYYAEYLVEIERRLAALGEYSGPTRYAVCTPHPGRGYGGRNRQHGNIATDKAIAAPGESVKITLTADPGFEAHDLKVVAEGKVIAKGDYVMNPSPLTFTMPASNVYVDVWHFMPGDGIGHGEEYAFNEGSAGGCSTVGLGSIAVFGAAAAAVLIKKRRFD